MRLIEFNDYNDTILDASKIVGAFEAELGKIKVLLEGNKEVILEYPTLECNLWVYKGDMSKLKKVLVKLQKEQEQSVRVLMQLNDISHTLVDINKIMTVSKVQQESKCDIVIVMSTGTKLRLRYPHREDREEDVDKLYKIIKDNDAVEL